MRRPRRNHTAAFRAKVALAALKGDRTLAELAEKYDVDSAQGSMLVHLSIDCASGSYEPKYEYDFNERDAGGAHYYQGPGKAGLMERGLRQVPPQDFLFAKAIRTTCNIAATAPLSQPVDSLPAPLPVNTPPIVATGEPNSAPDESSQDSRPNAADARVQSPQPSARAEKLEQAYESLMRQARADKMRYLKAAKLYQQEFRRLFPEQSGNALMKEYLAYMAVIAEKIDLKNMTETEAEYELARKESELEERASAAQARTISAQQAQQDEGTRKANDEAAARKANEEIAARRARDEAAVRAQASIEQQRLALEREIAEKQLQQQRRNAALQAGILLLTQPPSRPNATSNCRWFANAWVCY